MSKKLIYCTNALKALLQACRAWIYIMFAVIAFLYCIGSTTLLSSIITTASKPYLYKYNLEIEEITGSIIQQFVRVKIKSSLNLVEADFTLNLSEIISQINFTAILHNSFTSNQLISAFICSLNNTNIKLLIGRNTLAIHQKSNLNNEGKVDPNSKVFDVYIHNEDLVEKYLQDLMHDQDIMQNKDIMQNNVIDFASSTHLLISIHPPLTKKQDDNTIIKIQGSSTIQKLEYNEILLAQPLTISHQASINLLDYSYKFTGKILIDKDNIITFNSAPQPKFPHAIEINISSNDMLSYLHQALPIFSKVKGEFFSKILYFADNNDPKKFSLEAKIDNISLKIPSYGLKIKPMNMVISGDNIGKFAINAVGKIRNGEGDFKLTGNLQPFDLTQHQDLHLEGTNLEFINTLGLNIIADANLRFKLSDLKILDILGDVRVTNGKIMLNNLPFNSAGKQSDVIFVDSLEPNQVKHINAQSPFGQIDVDKLSVDKIGVDKTRFFKYFILRDKKLQKATATQKTLASIKQNNLSQTDISNINKDNIPQTDITNIKVNPNINLRLEDKIVLQGYGINSRLSGKLKIYLRSNHLSANGRLSIKEGTFAIGGSEFDFVSGRLFYYPYSLITNPNIDIKLTPHTQNSPNKTFFQDDNAAIIISGTLQEPKIIQQGLLDKQEQIISQALIASSGASILQPFKRALHINEIALEDKTITSKTQQDPTNNINNNSLMANKNLLIGGKLPIKNLYLQYLHSTSNPEQAVRIVYPISSKWLINFELGTTDSGADVGFAFEK